MTEKWLDWKHLGPLAMQYQALIADEVKADTRKSRRSRPSRGAWLETSRRKAFAGRDGASV